MSVNLSPLGGAGAQFFSNDGVPLSGGLLYTYQAGTTTPATTYTSGSGVTALSNPIVLDSAGRVPTGEIWLTDGINYKFVLKDSADVLIATWDGLSGINSNFIAYTAQEETATATAGQTVFTLALTYLVGTDNLAVFVNGSKQIVNVNYLETDGNTVTFLTGLNVGDVVEFNTASPVATNIINAANVQYNPAGSQAVTTNVQAKLREMVSVKDFGAAGDGVTDDTTAIQNAISAALHKTLFFPTGQYLVSSSIALNTYVSLQGEGPLVFTASTYSSGSVLVKSATMTAPLLAITADEANVSNLGFRGLAGNTGDGIFITARKVALNNVIVTGMGQDGVRIGNTTTGTNANLWRLSNVQANANTRYGFYVNHNNGGLPDCNGGTSIGCSAQNNGADGLRVENASQNTFVGLVVETNSGWGVYIGSDSTNTVLIGGDNAEVNTLGNLYNAGESSQFFNLNTPSYTEAGTYTVNVSPTGTQLAGELKVTPIPSSQQGGANYLSTQVLVDGFYGGSSGSNPVTNATTYRLFTCDFDATNGAVLQGTLYIAYHPSLGSGSTARTIKAYSISAYGNSGGLGGSKITELTEYSDVDGNVTSNVPALTYAGGVLTVKNTNTRSDGAGQLMSWSFIGYQRKATNFTSVTAV